MRPCQRRRRGAGRRIQGPGEQGAAGAALVVAEAAVADGSAVIREYRAAVCVGLVVGKAATAADVRIAGGDSTATGVEGAIVGKG